MSHEAMPRVSYVDIDIAVITLKDLGGIAALSGIRKAEMALVLPDGSTTLFTDFDKTSRSARMIADLDYLGVMRREELWRPRKFYEIPSETIDWGDRLVLQGAKDGRLIRPTVYGLQTRLSGFYPVFAEK